MFSFLRKSVVLIAMGVALASCSSSGKQQAPEMAGNAHGTKLGGFAGEINAGCAATEPGEPNGGLLQRGLDGLVADQARIAVACGLGIDEGRFGVRRAGNGTEAHPVDGTRGS